MAKAKPNEQKIIVDATTPGRTFVALGKMWGVTARTAKTWCVSVGIEKAGVPLVTDSEPEPKPEKPELMFHTDNATCIMLEPKPKSFGMGTIGQLIKDKQPEVLEKIENLPLSAEKELYAEIDALKCTVSKLRQELAADRKVMLHFKDDVLLRIEEIFSQASEPQHKETTPDSQTENFISTMLAITKKVIAAGAGEAHLDVNEQKVYHQFRPVIQYATRDLRYVLNNHHHKELSIVDSKEYAAKQREARMV